MERILLFGANGMLGRGLCPLATDERIELYAVARSKADFCIDLTDDDALAEVFAMTRPTVCINAAANVSIDACEHEPGAAYRINARLPERLAMLSEHYGTYLVHVSTDHYWSGDERRKHSESECVTLSNEYARTKYIGELLALRYDRALVLRTNIVGFRGSAQPTFLEWVIMSLREQRHMTLFTDFYTSTIHTVQFAQILEDILHIRPTGLFHLASSTVSSKEEFICTLSQGIFSRMPSYDAGTVAALSTVRANSLGLDTHALEAVLGYEMPALDEVIASICEMYREVA